MNQYAEKERTTSRRKKLRRELAGLALALVTGFSACSSRTSNQNEGAKSSATPTAAVPSPTSSRAVVESVGQHGENLYDLAKAGDWQKAATEFTALLQSDQQLRNKMKDKSADLERLNQALTAAGRAVETKDRFTTMREANLITLIGADLAAAFHPPVPVEVTRLDYYGRELEVWSALNGGTLYDAENHAVGLAHAHHEPLGLIVLLGGGAGEQQPAGHEQRRQQPARIHLVGQSPADRRARRDAGEHGADDHRVGLECRPDERRQQADRQDLEDEDRARRGEDESGRAPHAGTSASREISPTDRQPARPIVRSKSAWKFCSTSRTPSSPAIDRP